MYILQGGFMTNQAKERIEKIINSCEFKGGISLSNEKYIIIYPKELAQAILDEVGKMLPDCEEIKETLIDAYDVDNGRTDWYMMARAIHELLKEKIR
jgi:hypothetical protein